MKYSAKNICKFTRTEILVLKKSARTTVRSAGMRILAHPSAEKPGRMLVITPRATGSAPQRNLLRRRLKAIFYEEQLAQHHLDVVVIANKEATKLTFEETKHLLVLAFKRGKKTPPPATTG